MAGPPYLEPEGVRAYYTEDSYLSRILIFYWPVTTAGSTVSSRHRVTIFTKIGHASFPPFQVSPQSAYYGAVAQLSDERQRDEIYRVTVFSLARYFDTLPAASKENGFDSGHSTLFDDKHAGAIANKLCRVTNPVRVLEDVQSFYSSSSKLQQAPSRPTSSSRSSIFSSEQKQALRLAMCEVVDTEERYVSKMHELLFNIISEFREKSCTKPPTSTSPSDEALSKLFPSCLDAIFTVNRGFLDSVRHVLESTEEAALASIAAGKDEKVSSHDSLGIRAFSKVLCEWFPRFLYPYKEYLYAHTTFSALLTSLMKSHAQSSFSRRVRETGEQKLRSMLMEPVQRLPRYSLLIDSMTQPLPIGEPSLKLLAKARDVVSEICAMETPVSKVLDSLTISYEEEKAYRSLSPVKFLSGLATGEDNMVVIKNVPKLAAPGGEDDQRRREREEERGRDRGGGLGLRRALSRRVSPPKRDSAQVLKENAMPNSRMGMQQQQLDPVMIELERLRRENAELRDALERCTCGATNGHYGYR
jgi:RhoGEF domain/Domain of unknown function (DUF3507)